jgi:hypothetical protein
MENTLYLCQYLRIAIANKGSGWGIIDSMRYTGGLENPLIRL